jgi:hypothetical protein
VGHAPPGQLLVQHHTLDERHQLVVHAVQEAQRRQPFQVVYRAVLELQRRRPVRKPECHQHLVERRTRLRSAHLYVVAEGKAIGHAAMHQPAARLPVTYP